MARTAADADADADTDTDANAQLRKKGGGGTTKNNLCRRIPPGDLDLIMKVLKMFIFRKHLFPSQTFL